MADVFLTLGAAVVKSALKIWLRDYKFADDTSASVVDLLEKKISGDLDQRRARRFFEDLEIPVANRMRMLRQSEFRNMPENEWTAAVLAAGRSFDNAQLTADKLFVADLNPLFLERQVRTVNRTATRDLSADGTDLYNRIITEGCAHAIEIADKLPHFQVGVFAELLRRDHQILDLISKVLDQIPDKTKGQSQQAEFTTAYIRHLATKLDKLELFGLDIESPWFPLSIAYITLQAEADTKAKSEGEGESRENTRREKEARTEDARIQDDRGAETIEDRLALSRRTMVLGRAGSGKTTVLQWMAVRAARSDFTGPLTGLNGYIPFFIRLREYVGRELPLPEQFIMGVASILAPEMPADWSRDQLRSGRALVLVDGVDELPISERQKVIVWLEDLIQLFPLPRYVVTARSAAVSADWLSQLGFTPTSLEAMAPSLIKVFVRQWYRAASNRASDNDERDQLIQYESALLEAINSDRYLRDLADTPLLAGLLCALNRHVRSKLPRRRCEIYGKALAMFDQRDRVRGIVTSDITLDLTAKTRILADLAFWMIRNGESEVRRETAIGSIGRSLPSLPNVPAEPDEVFRVLLERSGLLREPIARHVDFVHLTFQEYLAATAAVDGHAIGELLRNASNDQWREVLIMAAGQSNQPQTAQLIQGLLKWRGYSSAKLHRRRMIAVECLQEVRSLDKALIRAVESIIESLLPPCSYEQAEQLSKLGKLIIPLLARDWSLNGAYPAETIRAASLVGGMEALKLIRDIGSRHLMPAVSNQRNEFSDARRIEAEVMRAWQYFEADNYAREVLAPLQLTNLQVPDITKVIDGLSYLTSTTYLTILWIDGDVDLQMLARLPKLDTLVVSKVDVPRLRGLAGCHGIKHVAIYRFVGQFSELELPPSIEKLTIRDLWADDLSGLERFSGLIEITLGNCLKLRNVDSLFALPNLKRVNIENFGHADLGRLLWDSNINVNFAGPSFQWPV